MTKKVNSRQLLLETLERPLMFCSCKEALLARCTTVLELEGVVDPDFYARHLGSGDQAPTRYDQAWAEQVIGDALSQLDQAGGAGREN